MMSWSNILLTTVRMRVESCISKLVFIVIAICGYVTAGYGADYNGGCEEAAGCAGVRGCRVGDD